MPDVDVGTAQPLQAARRLLVLAVEHEIGGCFRYEERAEEEHRGRDGDEEGALTPVQVVTRDVGEQHAYVPEDLEHRREAAADARQRDLRDVDLEDYGRGAKGLVGKIFILVHCCEKLKLIYTL